MDVLKDDELLTAHRAGDREAFAVLVARYEGLLRAACQRQAPPGEADDCLQAVFLVLARRPAAAAAAPALAAWLLRVCSFVCRRAQRAVRRRRRAEAASAQQPPADMPARTEALDHLDDCLARLPERQRAAVSMQYLAGMPVESIASELGVSRDNAYQLVSRGLAALRALLLRRGIALAAPALLALLAAEARAAGAVVPQGGSLAATITTAPTPHAVALANGACFAMTATAPATLATLAASLLLAVGLGTAVLSAEPGAPAPTPAPAPGRPGPQVNLLDQEIGVDFNDVPLADALAFLQRAHNCSIIIDPKLDLAALPAITFRCERMKLRFVLDFLCRLSGTSYGTRGDAIIFLPAAAKQAEAKPAGPAPPLDLANVDAAVQARLEQKLTLDLADTPLVDALAFLRQVSGVNIVVSPQRAQAPATVTFKAEGVALRKVLLRICHDTGSSVRYVDQALFIDLVPAQ